MFMKQMFAQLRTGSSLSLTSYCLSPTYIVTIIQIHALSLCPDSLSIRWDEILIQWLSLSHDAHIYPFVDTPTNPVRTSNN